MARGTNRGDLMKICSKYSRNAPPGVVFKEPYTPYVPKPWNGVLVLAEAQNISTSDSEYATWLQGLSRDERFRRLDLHPDYVGVGPWDDGYVRLAVKAMLPTIEVEQTAVGNAVPWTKRERKGKNANPDERMKDAASAFWAELLSVWRPDLRLLVVLGKVAEYVMDEADALDTYPHIKLRLPSPSSMQRVSGLFLPDDLRRRFPEVGRAAKALGMTPNHHQCFFACHAVSHGRSKCKAMRLS